MSSLATVNLLNTNSVKYGSTNVKKIKLGYMELWPENKQYVKHDWLEGNQAWIDTGIKPKWEWRYELKIRITNSTVLGGNYNTFMESLNEEGYLIGMYSTTGKNIYIRCEDNTVKPRIGELNEGTVNISAGYFMEYVIDPQNKYIKGVKKNSSGEVVESYDMTTGVIPQASGDMNNYSIHLFARSVNETLNNQPIANCKMYYFKIYAANTDTLVHNFVPCHDTLNNKHGLIDTETGIFYQNANSSGSFECGDDILYYDWIQNTSPAYINTGINPRGEWKYELKFKVTDSYTLNEWYPVAGATTFDPWPKGSSSSPKTGIWFNKQNLRNPVVRYYYNKNKVELASSSNYIVVGDTLVYTINVYGQYLSIERITSAGVSSKLEQNGNITVPSGEMIPYPIYLFTKADQDLIDIDRNGATYPCKIYYFKIYDGSTNELVHNFVPAVNNNVHGMADTVTGQFYTNANSSGTLTCGND